MSARLQALRRIVAVQDVIRKRAEAALGAAERDKAELEALRQELDVFAANEALSGAFANLADAQARRLAQRDKAATAMVSQRRVASQAAEARHTLTGKVLDRTLADEKAWAERRSLEQLIDEMVGRSDAD